MPKEGFGLIILFSALFIMGTNSEDLTCLLNLGAAIFLSRIGVA